jgi:hypothetical protein
VGKERWFAAYDLNGLFVGSGLLDHMTVHCWGVADGIKSIAQYRGYCVFTDPAGDQIAVEDTSDGKIDLGKPANGINTITAGTGKYSGISGTFTYVAHSSEFKTAEKGTFAQYTLTKGSYKLP